MGKKPVDRWVAFWLKRRQLKGVAESMGFPSADSLFAYPAEAVEAWLTCEKVLQGIIESANKANH